MNAMRYVSGTKLDDRIIRTDWDMGFEEGRQYGRGRSGGQVCAPEGKGSCDRTLLVHVQVRDDYRTDYDDGRGGFGGRAKDAFK